MTPDEWDAFCATTPPHELLELHEQGATAFSNWTLAALLNGAPYSVAAAGGYAAMAAQAELVAVLGRWRT